MAAPSAYPAVLQINQSGSWRTALTVDLGDVPEEFMGYLDRVLRLASRDKLSARIVATRPGDNGSLVATTTVLKRWSRPEGWVNT